MFPSHSAALTMAFPCIQFLGLHFRILPGNDHIFVCRIFSQFLSLSIQTVSVYLHSSGHSCVYIAFRLFLFQSISPPGNRANAVSLSADKVCICLIASSLKRTNRSDCNFPCSIRIAL